MGAVHSRAARASRARLVALATSTKDRAAEAARSYGIERGGDILDVATASDIDVVHVCTPNRLHAEHALAALGTGKHLICEKPLAS